MNTPAVPSESSVPTSRSRAWAWVEFAIIAVIFWGDIHHWRHHFIILSKTINLLVVGWVSLRLRGLRWRSVGFSLPQNWRQYLGIGIIAGILMEALELFVTQPLLERITHKPPDLSELMPLIGNWQYLLLALAAAWTLAALGEELVYRGYLLNRIQDVLGSTRPAIIAALLLMSVVFGMAHFYQGVTGVIENTIDGLILGALYLRFGRNLMVPIIAHGVTDSIDVLLIYAGHYPGFHR